MSAAQEDLFVPSGEHDQRLALNATGLLRTFNRAGVLTAADVHVARRIGALGGEPDERVLLAVALATRAVRFGSVCLDLGTVPEVARELPWPGPEEWTEVLAASPLVRAGVLRWDFDLLYLDRYWHQEVQVCADLKQRLSQPPPAVDQQVLETGLARVFSAESYGEQRAAARTAVAGWTTVLTGGPGTGKTTTVAGVLALLFEQAALSGDRLRVALTAPTGKAAARLQEAVATAARDLPPEDQGRLGTLPASTLHRLLGTRRDNATRFRHHRTNRLPHDVVVVDETSMVPLTMMARLLEAVRSDARVIFVGDPDQLASVEAGAVLADVVSGLGGGSSGPVAALQTSHRFGEEIGLLASALRAGDADQVVRLLRAGSPAVELVETDSPEDRLRGDLLEVALELRSCADTGDVPGALDALGRHRLLCAHRDGPYGVRHWNRQVERWLAESLGEQLHAPTYPGRPLLVTANDYGLGLYNGDTGIVVRVGDGTLRAAIAATTGPRTFAPTRLDDVETMHAMTIHKSQGSQADVVTVLLPAPDSRLLTRELFYTAITRARDKVRLVGTEASVRAAVERRVQRASGLRRRLTAD